MKLICLSPALNYFLHFSHSVFTEHYLWGIVVPLEDLTWFYSFCKATESSIDSSVLAIRKLRIKCFNIGHRVGQYQNQRLSLNATVLSYLDIFSKYLQCTRDFAMKKTWYFSDVSSCPSADNGLHQIILTPHSFSYTLSQSSWGMRFIHYVASGPRERNLWVGTVAMFHQNFHKENVCQVNFLFPQYVVIKSRCPYSSRSTPGIEFLLSLIRSLQLCYW